VQVIFDDVSELVHVETKIPFCSVVNAILGPDEPSENVWKMTVWPVFDILVAAIAASRDSWAFGREHALEFFDCEHSIAVTVLAFIEVDVLIILSRSPASGWRAYN